MSSLLRVAILGLALVALLISFSATEDIPGVPKTDLNAIRERTYLSDDEAEMAKINEQSNHSWEILDPIISKGSRSANVTNTRPTNKSDDYGRDPLEFDDRYRKFDEHQWYHHYHYRGPNHDN
ncbi:hypothetical protein TCAL_01613 [Tigriopus californicus]|uniref:Uncharacterized protein n=1 Tax=Tigriopus californicus TaxID=6832 RepID=A0A553P9M5_TIGCA|nr:hypothetical protein TCAL_01613 [Tigriopus californicus]